MKNIAVYPGTFDPITYGHVDLIERASKLFDKVIVAIGVNQSKTPIFNVEERIVLAKKVLTNSSNVSVVLFDGLLIDFLRKQQAKLILRGLRTVTDFDYEFQLTSMNRVLDPSIETIFLMPSEKYMYISSSLVREIAMLGGEISKFVPPAVAKALQEKYEKR